MRARTAACAGYAAPPRLRRGRKHRRLRRRRRTAAPPPAPVPPHHRAYAEDASTAAPTPRTRAPPRLGLCRRRRPQAQSLQL